MMGKIKKDWQDTGYLLGLFGKTLGAAKRSYSAFVANGVAHGRHPGSGGRRSDPFGWGLVCAEGLPAAVTSHP